MRRVIFLSIVLVLSLLLTAGPAAAVPPERGSFSFSEEGVDPAGTTCAFPVHFSQTEYGSFKVFFDQNGDFDRTVLHINYDATMRDAGLTTHIQGPGGVVLRDAGLIVYSDTEETVAYVRGPHPQLSGESFCPALGG
jgi:hypothetical protein